MNQQNPTPKAGRPACNEPCGSAQTGGATTDHSIDLRTGQFSYAETNTIIPDIIPIEIGRSYRPTDAGERSFGLATGSQAAVTYDYDDADLLRKLQQGSEIVTMDYDLGNRITQQVLPNGDNWWKKVWDLFWGI